MTSIRVAAVTHRGLVRAGNEDSYGATALVPSAVDGEVVIAEAGGGPFLAVVADGLGGHPCGEVASALAVEQMLAAKATDPESLLGAVHAADRRIIDAMNATGGCGGMATTLAAVLVHATGLAVVNVGDSPVLEYADGRLVQLTIDDVPHGRPSLPGFPSARVTQTLGGRVSTSAPHLYTDKIRGPRRLLLCTDGLTSFVSSRSIATTLEASPAGEAIAALVQQALAASGADNITCMLVELE
jgi:serine/threonine protein phosphatase PrpC